MIKHLWTRRKSLITRGRVPFVASRTVSARPLHCFCKEKFWHGAGPLVVETVVPRYLILLLFWSWSILLDLPEKHLKHCKTVNKFTKSWGVFSHRLHAHSLIQLVCNSQTALNWFQARCKPCYRMCKMFKAIDGMLQSVKGDNGLLPRKSDLTSSDKIFRKN